MDQLLLLIQGPVYTEVNGYSTADVLKALHASELRRRFYIVCTLWEDEDPRAVADVRHYVDRVVSCRKPAVAGSGNRNLHREGVSQALDAVADLGFRHVLKTRTDFLLSDKLLRRVVELAEREFERVLVTNVYTRYEPFHVSDMLLFSTFENVRQWFDPRPVYYEDLYSPEVQFARVFVRNKGLPYSMRLEDYLRFLRDWVELVDFEEQGLLWFKHPRISRRLENRSNPMLLDRDGGPILGRLVSVGFLAFLRRSGVSPAAVATGMSTLDPLARAGVLGLSWFLEHVLRVKPRYFELRLPGGYTAEIKLGLASRRYAYYTVDPDGTEYAKPLAENPSKSTGRPREHGEVTKGQPGLFAFSLRRRDADEPESRPPA